MQAYTPAPVPARSPLGRALESRGTLQSVGQITCLRGACAGVGCVWPEVAVEELPVEALGREDLGLRRSLVRPPATHHLCHLYLQAQMTTPPEDQRPHKSYWAVLVTGRF